MAPVIGASTLMAESINKASLITSQVPVLEAMRKF